MSANSEDLRGRFGKRIQRCYGCYVAYYLQDMWLADGNTGKPIRRLLKSSSSGNYETFRFITSSASWAPDGKRLAIAAQRSGKDDIVIVDAERNKHPAAHRRRDQSDLERGREAAGVQRAGRRIVRPLHHQ